jgi:hypothetical protein
MILVVMTEALAPADADKFPSQDFAQSVACSRNIFLYELSTIVFFVGFLRFVACRLMFHTSFFGSKIRDSLLWTTYTRAVNRTAAVVKFDRLFRVI